MSDTGRQDQAGWFRWWYWPLGAVILALTIVPFIRISYQKRVERLEASLRADGIPVTARELAEAYPDPPREENAATVYRSAYTHFKPWPGEDKAPAGYVPGDALPPPGKDWSPALRKKVDAFLDENNAAVERLVRASRMEVCHWSGNLERGFHAAVPNLLKIKAATSLLGLKAIEAAERGDMDAAEEALAAQFRLARSLEDEPFLIVQLIRIALVHMCLESLERVTARDECPRSLLVRFQRVLRASEAVESLEHAIIGERAVANSLSRKPTHDLLQMMNLKSRHGQALFLGYNFCGGWAADRLWFLNCYNELLRISRLPPAERLAEGHRLRDAFEPPWYSWLGHMFLLNMYEIQKSEAGGIAGCRAARTALAVLRFHLQKGRAPERLEELVPGYIDSIPVDPFDGAPLRYKRTGDSFAVYSIGEDMTDDGGDEHMDFVFSRE